MSTQHDHSLGDGVYYEREAYAGFWQRILVKRSRLRTLGYRLLGLRIVTTSGTQPSIITMTFRLLMWIFGPFNFLIDLLWLGADTEQQTLRDCYCGTYVIRQDAEPIGTAAIHLARYHGMGMTLVYPRVVRPESTTTDDGHGES